MRKLYHYWLSPECRAIRLLLREKQLGFDLAIDREWQLLGRALSLNPAGSLPVFVDETGEAVCGFYAIAEYLEELYPTPTFLGRDILQRAETRRLVDWFGNKFQNDVTQNLLFEKALKRHYNLGHPDSQKLRLGLAKIHDHLAYISWCTERANWLAGDMLSLADFLAGGHLSCIDYFGDIPWDAYPEAKSWYARLKSRPSFRPILNDNVPGVTPAQHYGNLDF